MLARLRRTAALVVATGCVACGSAPSNAPLSAEEAQRRQATRASVAQHFVSGAELDEKLDAVFERPAVEAAGEALWTKIENDPQLAAAGERFIARAFAGERLAALIQSLASEHPNWSEQQFSAFLEQRVEVLTESPEYDAEFDRLVESPVVEEGVEVWASRIAEDERLIAAVQRFFVSPRWRDVWTARLGETEQEHELMEKLDAYLVSDEGAGVARRIGLAIVDDPALEQMLVDLLGHASVMDVVAAQLLAVLDDPEVAEAADELMYLCFSGEPLAKQVLALRRTLETDAVQKAFADVFLEAARRPEIHDSFISAFLQVVEHLENDEKLVAELSARG